MKKTACTFYPAKLIVVILCLFGVLAACQSQGAGPETADVTPTAAPVVTDSPESETITLTIASRAGSIADGVKTVITRWEQMTGHRVVMLELPYAYLQEKVFTDVLTGLGHYDVVFIDDPWLPALAGGGHLVPLSQFGYQEDPDFVALSLDVARWPPPYGPQPPDKAADEQPELYALPLVGNVQMFWYRKDLIPQEPTTITEFMAVVRETADPDNGLYGYAYRDGWGNPIVTEFNAWNWSYGGNIFDDEWHVVINQEKSVQALTDFIDFSRAVAPRQAFDSNQGVLDAMLNGASLTAVVWPNQNMLIDDPTQSSVSGKIGVTAFPGGERRTSQLGNWLVGVPVTSPHKQVAFDFMVWLTSRETMRQIATTGLPPTRESIFHDEALVREFWWLPQTHTALQNATWRPRLPEWTKVENILGNYLVQALDGRLTPQEALNQAADEITAVMQQTGYLD